MLIFGGWRSSSTQRAKYEVNWPGGRVQLTRNSTPKDRHGKLLSMAEQKDPALPANQPGTDRDEKENKSNKNIKV